MWKEHKIIWFSIPTSYVSPNSFDDELVFLICIKHKCCKQKYAPNVVIKDQVQVILLSIMLLLMR